MSEEYNCEKCKHQETDVCDECSKHWGQGCSCHINPPCSYCVEMQFEEEE